MHYDVQVQSNFNPTPKHADNLKKLFCIRLFLSPVFFPLFSPVRGREVMLDLNCSFWIFLFLFSTIFFFFDFVPFEAGFSGLTGFNFLD